MSFTTPILLAMGILFISTFIRSAIGFGDALVAMPLLAMALDIQTATPLVAFAASTIALTILLKNWRSVDIRSAWRLILLSLVGIPFGLVLLKVAPAYMVKAVLGVLLILYGLYSLITPRLPEIQSEKSAYIFGFIAGVLGGAYNTNGPPIVMYGLLRRWPPESFRATLQCYFLFTGLLISAGRVMDASGVADLSVLDSHHNARDFRGRQNQQSYLEGFLQPDCLRLSYRDRRALPYSLGAGKKRIAVANEPRRSVEAA
jgi:uncharacterized membrane protein YfcA